MIEIEAIDMFVDSDPAAGDDDEGDSLISLRVPSDREFSRQIKELGAKWDDAAKEWRMVGNEATIKQISALCKAVFPKLPRRRNRLIATQVSTAEGNSWADNGAKKTGSAQSRQLELIVRVEFVVNRTMKTYRRGQNLKWLKEFREVIELPASASAAKPGETSDDTDSDEIQNQYASRLQSEIRELERSATEAFEALLLGRKEAVAAVLKEAGIAQV